MPRKEHGASLHDADLVSALRRRGVVQPETFLADFKAVTIEALAVGREVHLFMFGTFHAPEFPAKAGQNPRTGRTIRFPAHRKVIFRVSRILLDAINFRQRRRRLGHG